MSFFKVTNPNLRCAAIVDIGGGSVGIAIVTSESDTDTYNVIWSHREHTLIKSNPQESDFVREITTAVINALLELGNAGAKTLKTYDPSIKIESIQVALSAPWSYTVTKSVHYEDQEPFMVTSDLVEQLAHTAESETTSALSKSGELQDVHIEIITSQTVDVTLNGYSVEKPVGKKCTHIDLAHISIAAEEKILATVRDACHKILPNTPVTEYSFMYLYYQVVKHLHPDTNEVCLIDITNEATEIGIVRDNVLRHTTYIPHGMYSLARTIADACAIPKEEAFGILKSGREIKEIYTQAQVTEIEKIYTQYTDALSLLFTQTGDILSVPNTFFLHTTSDTELFFSEQIKIAAKNARLKNANVLLCTKQLLGEKTIEDTALALSIHFFHHKKTYLLT